MANPSTLSIGSRIVFTPGFVATGAPLNPPQQPLGTQLPPTGNPTPALIFGSGPEIPGMVVNQGTLLPGLVQTVAGSAPDFIGSSALVHDLTGRPFLVVMGVNATTWASAGSPAGQRRWQYIDLSLRISSRAIASSRAQIYSAAISTLPIIVGSNSEAAFFSLGRPGWVSEHSVDEPRIVVGTDLSDRPVQLLGVEFYIRVPGNGFEKRIVHAGTDESRRSDFEGLTRRVFGLL